MKSNNIQPKRVAGVVLIILLLSVVGIKAMHAQDTYHWNVNINQFPSIMTMTGIVLIDDEEQIASSLEIGAFCGNECRGCQSLEYYSEIGGYLVFLVIHGVDNDRITFRLYDHNVGEDIDKKCSNTITFVTNTTYGTPTNPFIFSFYENIITFVDSNVKALCVANWDTNNDSELSYSEAAAVTDLGTIFMNKTITSFTELQYFTGLTEIDQWAFKGCSGLTSIVIPNSVISISNIAFENCWELSNLAVDENNLVYDSRDNCNAIIITASNSLFLGCKNTIIPNSVTSIGDQAFLDCQGLTTIEIPNSVTSIGYMAFGLCTGLTMIEIPNSVMSISNTAFNNCSGLEQIVVAGDNTVFDSRDNCNAIIHTDNNQLFLGCKNTIIPDNINSIGLYAFYGCIDLTSIEIPNSVQTIGNYAFAMSGLTSIEIPSSVTTIGYEAFVGCADLSLLTIGDAVTLIEGGAFRECTGLTSIISYASVPPTIEIGFSGSFYNVDKTIPVYVPYGTVSAYESASGWNEFTYIQNDMDTPITFADPVVKSLCVDNWDTNGDGELSYAEAAAVTDLGEVFRGNHDITSFDELQYFTGLTEIVDNAFNYSISLSSITLPNTITIIGSKAFYQCYNLQSIEIPGSVTMIENEVFGLTSNLAHITVDLNNTVYDSRNDCNAIINSTTNALLVGCYNTIIPNTVTTIERYAFMGCENLTSIIIPNSVTTIESETFFGCSGLTSILIPSSVSSIGSHVFACCNLAQIVVEQGNTHYDSRDNCNAIIDSETNALIVGCKNTIIPNTVTKIASSAFYACDGLTSIVIPQNVTELSYLAFYCCMNLDSITLNCVVPPTVGENAFVEVDKSIPVYVPCNTSAAYASAIGWNEFTNIQEILCVNIEATANPTIAGIVTGGGNYYKGVECTLNAVANEGYMFESWTENGVFVSDNPEYTFTVNEDRTLEANFISTQTTQLYSGWNWWSTYIEMDGFNGLEYLENTVGDLGICIKSQVCAVVNYFPATGESFWFGDDIVIDNENCYMIDVTDDCLVQLDGDKANPADHPIRIKPNWSWIGYIDNVTQSANTAMSDFEPIQEDVIKSKDDAATYWAGYGWYPAINLVPGQGYKYFSNSNEDRYLVYNNASNKSEVAKRQEKFWHYDTHSYANTMTVISVVDIDNEEVAKGNYELAAFVDNECRGSVKLDYFEPLDRYFAVMSIAGNDLEEISFGLADTSNGDVGFNCEQSMTFATDAVVGRLSSPYNISFNHENTDAVVHIYPNPVDRNASFTLDIPSSETISELLIVNSLGAEMMHQTGMTGKVVKGLPVSGIYSIQVITNTGNVYRGKLVVK